MQAGLVSKRQDVESSWNAPIGLLKTLEAKALVLYHMAAEVAHRRDRDQIKFPEVEDGAVVSAIKDLAFPKKKFMEGFFLAHKYGRLEEVVAQVKKLSADNPEYVFTDSFLGLPDISGRVDFAYEVKKALVKEVLLPGKRYDEAIEQLKQCNEPRLAMNAAAEISPERVAQLAEEWQGEFEWAIRHVKQANRTDLEARLKRVEIKSLVEGTERESGTKSVRWFRASNKANEYGLNEEERHEVAAKAVDWFIGDIEIAIKKESDYEREHDTKEDISAALRFMADLSDAQREQRKPLLFDALRRHKRHSEMYDVAIKLKDYNLAFEAIMSAKSIPREHHEKIEEEFLAHVGPENIKQVINRWFLGDYHRSFQLARKYGLGEWLIDSHRAKGTPQGILDAACAARDLENTRRAKDLFLEAGMPEHACNYAETDEEIARICVMAGEKVLKGNTNPRGYNFDENVGESLKFFARSMEAIKKESDIRKMLAQARSILDVFARNGFYIEAGAFAEQTGCDYKMPSEAVGHYERFGAFDRCAVVSRKLGNEREAGLYAQLHQHLARK